jgi:hypothetical protein
MPRDERFQITALINVHIQWNLADDATECRVMNLDVVSVLEFAFACTTDGTLRRLKQPIN